MSRNIPQVRTWKVTFTYNETSTLRQASEYVLAPTKLLALWAGREQRHGCMIHDPDCIKETVSLVRQPRSN